MSVARGAGLAALALAVVVVALLLLRATDAQTYVLYFQNAGQLVPDDDVQVGGRRVGAVGDISLADDNRARVEVEVEPPFAPLRKGTRAVIRQTSLSGIANRYIALTPGPQSSPELEEGAQLRADATTAPVDLDQLFNTFDERTRGDLQDLIAGFSTQYDGKAREINASARYFNPALSASRRLVGELDRDSATLTRFLVSTSKAMTALAERRDDLSGLVRNSGEVAGAIAQENAGFSSALDRLPGTLRKGNTTFVNLRSTLTDLDALVEESKPATRRLAPLFRELEPLLEESRPTVRDLSALFGRPGADNDLTDATRKLPRLQRVASPSFRNQIEALRELQPVLEFGRPYAPDLVGWLRDFGQTTANYDANGHYARVQPIFNPFRFQDDAQGGTLSAVPAGERFDGLRKGVLKRCPGAATQPPADGSAPFTDDGRLSAQDCDPALVVPGE